MARSMTFVIDGEVDTRITVTELDDGSLQFDIKVLGSGSIGDLRALFFDLQGFDSSTDGLIATSTAEYTGDITDQSYEEASVDTLGQDANIKGQVSNELGDFDVGIEFGTSGMSTDDIQETSFVLSYDYGDLSLDMMDLSDFGVRYTSVGDWDGYERTGSVKIGDQSNGVADNDALSVDENDQTTDNVLANDSNGDTNIVIGASWETGAAFTDTGLGLTGAIVSGGKTYGTISLLADGTINVVADGADVDSLADGETLEVSFTYTSRALDGSLATADATITINGLADATPIIAEAYDTLSVGTTGGSRMISVGTDGSLAQFDFLANNGGFAYGTALGDINGDGHLDLLMSGDWSDAFIYYGDGAGGFTDSGERFTGQFQSRVSIADIDNDGDGDIYLQNGVGAAEVWRNDGTGFSQVFSYTNIGSSGYYRTAGEAVFEDVNGDGYVDMLINQINGTLPIADKLFLNDGAGNFSDSGQVLPTGSGYANVVLADVNNDGSVDYVRGTATGIAVALNDGAGNFSSPVSDLGAAFNGAVALADFNGDGLLDAMRNNPDTTDGVELWLGDGVDGFVFEKFVGDPAAGYGREVQAGDFSGDGIADLLYSVDGAIKTMVNDGTGNFTDADTLALSGYIFGDDIGLL